MPCNFSYPYFNFGRIIWLFRECHLTLCIIEIFHCLHKLEFSHFINFRMIYLWINKITRMYFLQLFLKFVVRFGNLKINFRFWLWFENFYLLRFFPHCYVYLIYKLNSNWYNSFFVRSLVFRICNFNHQNIQNLISN